jgi:C-terminal processing protease CtpA/Prc
LLEGNVGYVDLRGFHEASGGGATAVAAMNFLAYADAIIFDLRQNGGGSPSMIQLITSYLLDEPTHLNSFYIRKDDTTKQFWTQAWVDGPKMSDALVYVLTSSSTFSGAEEFTYNLKNLKRGTIIGETTGGGAHPVDGRIFANLNVGMSLPFGRAVNPITGTNWEGTGVAPDIEVPQEKALDVAHLEALKALLEKADDPDVKHQLDWAIEGKKAQLEPYVPPEGVFKDYVGIYGPRRIWIEDGALYYQRGENPGYGLTPMAADKFMIKSLDYFRIEFVRDDSGEVVKLVGLYDNGRTDAHERDN